MTKEKINLTEELGVPPELLPAITFSMSKIRMKNNVMIMCKTRHYGSSNMMLVKHFYKPLIIL